MKPFEGDDADLGGWEESYHKVVPFISGLVEDNYLMRPKPDLLPALSILRRNQNALPQERLKYIPTSYANYNCFNCI